MMISLHPSIGLVRSSSIASPSLNRLWTLWFSADHPLIQIYRRLPRKLQELRLCPLDSPTSLPLAKTL